MATAQHPIAMVPNAVAIGGVRTLPGMAPWRGADMKKPGIAGLFRYYAVPPVRR